jgi:hypothetical protein
LKKGYADEEEVNKRSAQKGVERKPSSGRRENGAKRRREEPACTKEKRSFYGECSVQVPHSPSVFCYAKTTSLPEGG